MTIRTQISVQFSLIVASILTAFSLTIYAISAHYRQEEVYERLKRQARTTARLLIEVQEVDDKLLRLIDQNSVSAWVDEQVLVFGQNNRLLYSSVEERTVRYRAEWLAHTRQAGNWEAHDGDRELVGLRFGYEGRQYVVLASAYDQFGKDKQRNLALTLLWGWLAGLVITGVLGHFFAGRSLQPITRINRQIQTITAHDLRRRLDEGRRRDEIEQLAVNFNQVLTRLELAFEQQRSFIAHASHELRTPLTTLKSDVQLALRRPLTAEALRQVLGTMLPDIDRLSALINSLLLLARTLENIHQMALSPVRLDEIAFAAQEELRQAQPSYQVEVQYGQLPDTDTDTEIPGNEALLRRVVYNLLDNACKYAQPHRAELRISYDSAGCWLTVRDEGIGIDAAEQARIFEPFYRTPRSRTYEGFGIGLSVCRRIVELHRGRLTVVSEVGQGSTFTLWLSKGSTSH
jgi:two-component system, OmpR family, sensor histidine kinase ArlS